MTMPRLILILLSVVLSAAASAHAAMITTSARVQIVSGVEIEHIAPSLETTVSPTGAVVFHIAGPTDRAMNVAWTSSSPSPALISHDDEALLVWLEEGATDGHLLIEYE